MCAHNSERAQLNKPNQMLLTHATCAKLTADQGYSLITDGALAVADGHIAWIGQTADIPQMFRPLEPMDLQGRLVTPGLIDCHTHLVHGGNRAAEFERRLTGASYEEIARSGGGIVSTVKATRSASLESLMSSALARVDAMIAQGLTTIEIKSGYGLDQDSELKMLRVARSIGEQRPLSVRTSFLGAHAVPPEFQARADAYIDEVCLPALRAAFDEGLVDAVDGFCEGIAFNTGQIERVFKAARDLGLPVKLHAEQLSNTGGTQLAARYGALSADHLEYADAGDAAAMAEAAMTAVLLPGAFYTLGETRRPPIDALRANKVPMALATDCNPGSSPMTSLPLAMNMGCNLFQMTPLEALLGVTRHAARALGLNDRGLLAPGARADLCIWDAEHPAELAYRLGDPSLHARVFNGVFGC